MSYRGSKWLVMQSDWTAITVGTGIPSTCLTLDPPLQVREVLALPGYFTACTLSGINPLKVLIVIVFIIHS